jgi:hypothetical protein
MSGDTTAGTSTRMQRWLWWLAVILLCARLGFVLTQQPLAGFANQFDMLRNTGCLGLQALVDAAPGAATPQAPVSRYRTGMARDPSCLLGTEVLIAGLAVGLDRAGDALSLGQPGSMPLRLVGWTKALLLLLALAVVDRGLRAYPALRLVHAWVAALILVDPFNSLYLAGFYTEFAALLSAYLALMLPLPWLLAGRAPSVSALLFWGLVLAALALSRFQHAAIPLTLLVWLVVLGRRQKWPVWRLIAWPVLMLIPALALQLGLQGQYQTIADANRWNSFFGAALPAAEDPLEFVGRLQLPEVCAELVHSTWYLQRGRDARVECPQAFQLSRLAWSLQLAAEPAALARLVGRGVVLSGQWRPSYLGEVAGAEFQRMPAGRLGLGTSLADGIARLPFTLLLLFWTAPVLLVLLLLRRRPELLRSTARPVRPERDPADIERRRAALWLWPMLLMIVLLGWASSLVGDGYSELARHLHLAANAALVALALVVTSIIARVWRDRAAALRGLLVVMLIFELPWLALHSWVGAQGLAFGVLEQPATESAAASSEVRGWAMDPRGIERVDLVYADGSREALALFRRTELSGIFGPGIGSHGSGFRGPIDPARAAGELRIEVVPRQGASTVIDRRWLR